MIVEAENGEIAWNAVRRVPVDVVKLNMLPTLPANATGVIVGGKQLGGNFIWWFPTTHLR